MHRTPVALGSFGMLALLAIVLFAGPAFAQAPQPIFNGRDLAGWHGLQPDLDPRQLAAMSDDDRKARLVEWTADAKQHWRAENGELINDGQGPYLATDTDYADFELTLEYKLAPGGDSGVYLRGHPQVQIWDHTDATKAQHGADKGSGGLWNNTPGRPGKDPRVRADKPVGEWNALRVLMVGAYVTVWLNDQLVVDHALLENYFDRARPVVREGPIVLQTHGAEMRWRNVSIRAIAAEDANALLRRGGPAKGAGGADDGFVSIFNGQNFTGWRGSTDRERIEDGAIVSSAGELYTEAEYGDFTVRLEFQLPPAGNNGLAIRYPGQGDPAYAGMCEIQILDSPEWERRRPGVLTGEQHHASAYGLAAAEQGYLRPTGEWNYQVVTVLGHRIQVEVNGFPVMDADLSKAAGSEKFPIDTFPGRLRTRGHFGLCGHKDEVRFRNLEIKRLDGAPATRPATAAGGNSFAPGRPSFDVRAPREVPVVFGPRGLPMVRATLNGHELPPFVFDTGAGAMVITPKAADAAELPAGGSIEASGTGGNVQRPTRTGGAFALGPLTLAACTWLELPELDGPFAELAFGGPVAGIIGRDVFLAGLVDMDWANLRVVLHPADAPAPELPAGVEWMPFEWVNDLPTVRCRYEGDREGLFMLDTGHNGGVSFEGAAVERHKLLDGRKTSGGALAGVGGAGRTANGTLAWFELGGVRHENVPAAFATQPRPGGPARDGLIGMNLLRRYRILLDAPNGRVAFIPAEQGAAPATAPATGAE